MAKIAKQDFIPFSNKWPKRDAFREKLVNDQVKAVKDAEMLLVRGATEAHRRKLAQVGGFSVLIQAFDEWKSKPKVKKEAVNE